ncbi:MAG: hypothetical protein ACRDUY_05950 [Nitriliruptorales bacterium]
MVTRVLSVLRSADPGAARPADPVLDLNAYALAEDVELTLVLKAAGVELGLSGALSRAATVGGLEVPAPVAGDDLRALLASGVRVVAVEEDLSARGIDVTDLLEGIEVLPETDLGDLLVGHDVELTWSVT